MQYWLFAAGVAVLLWTWLLVRNGYVTGWAKLEESRKRLEQQATELAIVAEEVLADLSERADKLRELIAQADAVLARAPADGVGARPMGPVAATAPAATPDPAVQAASPDPAGLGVAADPRVPAAAPAANRPRRQEPPAVETATTPNGEALPPALALLSALEAAAAETSGSAGTFAERKPQHPVPPGHKRVWELAEQGEPVTEIARRLQKTQGEVELILGLRRLG